MKTKEFAAFLLGGAAAIVLSSCATAPLTHSTASGDGKNPGLVIEEETPEPPISSVYLVAPVGAD